MAVRINFTPHPGIADPKMAVMISFTIWDGGSQKHGRHVVSRRTATQLQPYRLVVCGS